MRSSCLITCYTIVNKYFQLFCKRNTLDVQSGKPLTSKSHLLYFKPLSVNKNKIKTSKHAKNLPLKTGKKTGCNLAFIHIFQFLRNHFIAGSALLDSGTHCQDLSVKRRGLPVYFQFHIWLLSPKCTKNLFHVPTKSL